MKTILLIYIPFIMAYIYLYANIYSNKKSEYNKIILDSEYYKKAITQLYLFRLPLAIIFFEMYCKNYFNIFALIFLAVTIYLTKEPLIKFITIHKGNYYIVREVIDYKIAQRYITENKKHKMYYYFRLRNFFKLSSKETKVTKKIFEEFEEKNKVYVAYDNNGNLINVYSAKEDIESEKVKEKIIKYEKIDYFNKKYIDNKYVINKEELNKIKEKEYKEVLTGDKITSLFFLILTIIFLLSSQDSGPAILLGVISLVFFGIGMHYYTNIIEFRTANENNEIKVKVEKIIQMTDYVNSLGKTGIKVEGQEDYSSVPHTQLGKATAGSMIYTIYYKDELFVAFDANQYVIAKDIPVEKE